MKPSTPLLIDVGSTYFKLGSASETRQWPRDFSRPILEDLMTKCGDEIAAYPPGAIESHVSFEEIRKVHLPRHECSVKGHDNAAITYTFSSVGDPKGIVIDHRALYDGAAIVSTYLEIRPDDVISGLLSFNLDYGLNQLFTTLYNTATLAIHKFVLPADFFTHLIDDGVTVLPLMPIHLSQIFDVDPHRIPQPQHFRRLRAVTSSGGNLTAQMIENVSTHFPDARLYSMHGLSEAFRSAYLDPAQIYIRPDSIGKAVPDVELYILNEQGEACKPREVGELIHRGPASTRATGTPPRPPPGASRASASWRRCSAPKGASPTRSSSPAGTTSTPTRKATSTSSGARTT
ncbi:AMP-binding protein [Nitratifractor sp.]